MPLAAGQDDAKKRKAKRPAVVPVHGDRDTAARDTTGRDMGQALRSIYQRTVDEEVPDEFLDLLGKLG